MVLYDSDAIDILFKFLYKPPRISKCWIRDSERNRAMHKSGKKAGGCLNFSTYAILAL